MNGSEPRALKDSSALAQRRAALDELHVAALNDWVRGLRASLGLESIVPYFDPADGGSNAKILWLLEAPGPRSTEERGGSGIISCDNNDGAAENTFRTRVEAGVDRQHVVHWNAIPYYIGSQTKIRAWDPGDVAFAGPMLSQLTSLLPHLRSVILGGKAAQTAWKSHGPANAQVQTFECPHPSVTNVNTRPWVWNEVVAAWRAAEEWSNNSTAQ